MIRKASKRVITRFLRAEARSSCAQAVRASAPSAFRATAGPARTKRVRAAASRVPGPAKQLKMPPKISRMASGIGQQLMSRSARAWLCRLLGFARLGADRLARRRRPEAERPPGGAGRDRGRGLRLPEIHPAAGRELRFVPDHAGRDTVDIRNLGAAKAKRVGAAGLLLLLGVSLTRARQHRSRQRRCEHQAELELPEPDSKHESPKALL